jgi:hypothetical protein
MPVLNIEIHFATHRLTNGIFLSLYSATRSLRKLAESCGRCEVLRVPLRADETTKCFGAKTRQWPTAVSTRVTGWTCKGVFPANRHVAPTVPNLDGRFYYLYFILIGRYAFMLIVRCSLRKWQYVCNKWVGTVRCAFFLLNASARVQGSFQSIWTKG